MSYLSSFMRYNEFYLNRANSSKLVLPWIVNSIFILIIIEMKETHMLLCIQDINTSLV